jgi:hypothetical protein
MKKSRYEYGKHYKLDKSGIPMYTAEKVARNCKPNKDYDFRPL